MLFRQHEEEVRLHIRWEHANVHGIRKGSGTDAASGTTCPPSIASIANRGDWSIGSILDIYLHFCEPGDQFLGRVLAGLDTNSPEFQILPPHFSCEGNPMDHPLIKEAMTEMFDPILHKWKVINDS